MKRAASPRTSPAFFADLSPWWIGAVLFAIVFAAYAPALGGGFIWDDDGHITRADLRSLAGLGRIWFELGATQQYYPVLHSAFWLEHLAFGDSPLGYHVLNVIFHASSACLLLVVLRRLEIRGAGLAALLFAVHPVCVESVAWISEQKNTLSTLFYLSAALAYLNFDRSRRGVHYAIATAFFFLAVWTKTVAGTLPATLLVVCWWRHGRVELRRDALPLLPWLLLAAVAGAITAWVEHTLVGAMHTDFDLGLWQRVLLACRVIWFYLGKLVFPSGLIFIYPRWTIDAGTWWQYLFPAGLALLAAAGWRWRQHRGPIAAGLIFAGSLFPALGFVNVYPFMFSFVADHFQYLASIAFFGLAGAGLTSLFARLPGVRGNTIASLLVAALALLTWRQSATYRDAATLYRATLAQNPSAWLAHNNLANILDRTGQTREAIAHFEAAIQLRPKAAEPRSNLGYALINAGEPAAAIPPLQEALRLQPDYVYAHANLGFALLGLGRHAEGEAKFRDALKLKPDYPEAQFGLALALSQQGKSEEALDHYAIAVRLRPSYPEAELNWGIALSIGHRIDEAVPHFERAIQLAPGRPDIRFTFGSALASAGRFEAASARLREALALAPDFAEAHYNLALILSELGQKAEAARHFAEAKRLGWRE